MKQTTIPARSEVAPGDTWNLASLFESDEQWNGELARFSGLSTAVNAFKPAFASPDKLSAGTFADCLDAYAQAQQLGEKLGNYAFLKKSADESDAANLDRFGRYMMAASAFEATEFPLYPVTRNLIAGNRERNDVMVALRGEGRTVFPEVFKGTPFGGR
ncbi:MAG TPA: hypothetical protein PK408_00560, partial [Treponemataceae bacterium]|nr:hypothetical protein [Treponemataceae bacterium]